MGWAAAIGAATSLYGAYQGRKAASAQGQQATNAANYAKGIYSDAQGNFSPYLGLGKTGADGLQKLYSGDNSGWNHSPDFLAARDAGLYGMDHSAGARLRLSSPGSAMDTAKGLGDISAGYLGNYRNGLMDLSRMGQQSAGQLGQIGTSISGQVGDAYGALGSAQAQHYGVNAGLASHLGNLAGGMFGGASSGGGGSMFGSSYTSGNTGQNNAFGMPSYNSGNNAFVPGGHW